MAALQINGPPAYFLLAWLAGAVLLDVRENRIPNALCLGAILTALSLQALSAGVLGIGVAIGGLLAGLLVLLPFYLAGGMSAGDVKLMATAGTFLGPAAALATGAFALIAGGALALVVVGVRTASAVHGGADYGTALRATRGTRFPFAAAIAIGTLVAYWILGDLPRHTGAAA